MGEALDLPRGEREGENKKRELEAAIAALERELEAAQAKSALGGVKTRDVATFGFGPGAGRHRAGIE